MFDDEEFDEENEEEQIDEGINKDISEESWVIEEKARYTPRRDPVTKRLQMGDRVELYKGILRDRIWEVLDKSNAFMAYQRSQRNQSIVGVSPQFRMHPIRWTATRPTPDNLTLHPDLLDSEQPWTHNDTYAMRKAMLKICRKLRYRQYILKSAHCYAKVQATNALEDQKIYDMVNKEHEEIPKAPLYQVAFHRKWEYNWEAVAATLNNRHSPENYRTVWQHWLHPHINQSLWRKFEVVKINQMVNQERLTDYEKIAERIGNGRTGKQVHAYVIRNHV